MTTTTAQTYSRDGADLGDLRNRESTAARQGAIDRGDLPGLVEATLERMGDLALAGRLAEARAMHLREFQKGN